MGVRVHAVKNVKTGEKEDVKLDGLFDISDMRQILKSWVSLNLTIYCGPRLNQVLKAMQQQPLWKAYLLRVMDGSITIFAKPLLQSWNRLWRH